MSEATKVAGIIVSGIACAATAVFGVFFGSDYLMNLSYSFGGVFGIFFGFPIAKTTLKKLFS